MDAGHREDGSYVINPTLIPGRHFSVFCKFRSRAWTVIQRRIDGEVDFNRTWVEYERGFGMFHGSFWLGLWKIHDLTFGRGTTVRLRINLKSRSDVSEKIAEYSEFGVGSQSDRYRLFLRFYDYFRSTVSDCFASDANGMSFTTFDQDNDFLKEGNCAAKFAGGWWHRNCFYANLNGIYPPQDLVIKACFDWVMYADYSSWRCLNNCYGDIIYSEMSVRNN